MDSGKLIELDGTKTCEWQMSEKVGKKTQMATGSVMTAGKHAFVMTCSFDADDVPTQKGCAIARHTWKAVR